MAVEARHFNLFPPQIHSNRDMMNMNETDGVMNVYGGSSTGMWYGMGMGMGMGTATPLSTTTAETLPPMYGSAITDSLPVVTKTVAVKADSGLTYAIPMSRKRTREENIDLNPLLSFTGLQNQNCNGNGNGNGNGNSNSHRSSASFTFLGEDMSFQINQQQLEIDRMIAQHAEKVRMEIDERRKRYSTRIITAVEQGIIKRLKIKEEEMEKICKLNFALEERVKSLCFENQIWRDLAQSNEATANALRSNLEQVLSQVHDDQLRHHGDGGGGGGGAAAAAAESCCGSNYDDNAAESSKCVNGNGNYDGNGNGGSDNNGRLCRNCGKDEACVLLLPCRHLCLCTVCGSSLHTCPICKATKNASLNVNMSFS